MSQQFEFEAALKELEQIAAWFERPDIDLDEGLVKFERGMELAQRLKEHLAGVENRVERIRRRFDREAVTESHQPADAAEADTTA